MHKQSRYWKPEEVFEKAWGEKAPSKTKPQKKLRARKRRPRLRKKDAMTFRQALGFARCLGISTSTEWQALRADHGLPEGMPTNPDQFYLGKGWKGWKHFFGVK